MENNKKIIISLEFMKRYLFSTTKFFSKFFVFNYQKINITNTWRFLVTRLYGMFEFECKIISGFKMFTTMLNNNKKIISLFFLKITFSLSKTNGVS